MAEKKKKKKDKQPEVPEAHMVNTGEFFKPSEPDQPQYKPMTIDEWTNWMNRAYDVQIGRAPQVLETQRQAQDVLFRNLAVLNREQGPATAATANALLAQYNPEFRQQYGAQQADINTLRGVTGRELGYGYDLGPELGGEIEQGIRGAQMARGNWLGNAPTAQEAFGKGQAAINLYQQRLGNYNQALGQQQNFLQGKNPTDMMGQMGGQFMGQQFYPNQQYVDTGLGSSAAAAAGNQGQAYNQTVMQGYGAFQQAAGNYNNALTGATQANNEAMFGQYDRTADAWMYREAQRRGLYSQPSVGGGGGMGGMGGMLGSVGGAVGTGMMGLAASGIIGTGATAGAVGIAGAAAGAAAAICWLARKLIPNEWKSFRKWLFTRATDEERRDYLYNARRLANAIT